MTLPAFVSFRKAIKVMPAEDIEGINMTAAQ